MMDARNSHWLCSAVVKKKLGALLKTAQQETAHLEDIYWIASSGTSDPDTFKFFGLSRQALENSAKSVNQFFGVTSKDCIYNVLPLYHVGGLGTKIRAELAKCKWVDGSGAKWNSTQFVQALAKNKVTITSLVPTQVFDLVTLGILPNPELRVVVVGGGRLDQSIKDRALKLGWPLTTSYGMTEHASQIANEMNDGLNDGEAAEVQAQWLDHVLSISDYKTMDGHKRIAIQSTSQCSYIYRIKTSGERSLEWAKTPYGVAIEDHITWDSTKRTLAVSHRLKSQVKVLGVLVNLEVIENAIRSVKLSDSPIVVGHSAHPRLENQIVLLVEGLQNFEPWQELVQQYNHMAPGPERIQRIEFVDQLPRNELGKIIRKLTQYGLE